MAQVFSCEFREILKYRLDSPQVRRKLIFTIKTLMPYELLNIKKLEYIRKVSNLGRDIT